MGSWRAEQTLSTYFAAKKARTHKCQCQPDMKRHVINVPQVQNITKFPICHECRELFFLPDWFSQFFSMLIVQEMLVLSEFVQSQMFPEKSEKIKVYETENSNMVKHCVLCFSHFDSLRQR